jgi:triphosphatase
MHTEIELKLLLDEKLFPQIATSRLVTQKAVSQPVTQHLISTYFDTLNFQLRKNKYSLRIRQVQGRYLQTLKSARTTKSGVTERHEWEVPVQTLQIEEEQLPASFRQQAIWMEVKDNLQPLFRTDFMRMAWDLSFGKDTLVELALDQGWVETQNNKTRILEIELELKAGYSHQIYDCALLLLAEWPVSIGYLSKAARGFSLLKNDKLSKQSSPVETADIKSHWQELLLSRPSNSEQWLNALPRWQNFLNQLHTYVRENPSHENTYWQLMVMRLAHDLMDLQSGSSNERDLMILIEQHAKEAEMILS